MYWGLLVLFELTLMYWVGLMLILMYWVVLKLLMLMYWAVLSPWWQQQR